VPIDRAAAESFLWSAARLVDRHRYVGPGALAPVGGAEGEALRPLDLSPRPDSRTRALFDRAQLDAHLGDVEDGQQEDGGWTFDWLAWSPAQTAAWRGTVTIRALTWLRDNGRL
jgi:hypothetical protein